MQIQGILKNNGSRGKKVNEVNTYDVFGSHNLRAAGSPSVYKKQLLL